MKRFLSTIVLSIYLIIAYGQPLHCDGSRYLDSVFDEVSETLNIKFGENITISGETKELLVDVFEPAGDAFTERPLLLLLHGGSYVGGNKESLHEICRNYAQRGYVAATMSYRLFDGPLIPLPDSVDLVEVVIQSVEDAYAGLRFFIDDSENGSNTFGIDADMIFLGGTSAGGITAVNTAYLDEEDSIPDFMAEFIDPTFGLTGNSNDLTTIDPVIQGVLNFSGATYNVSWLDENDEPIFSAHDDGDNVVPYGVGFASPFFGIPLVSLQGSEAIAAKATELGIVNELVTFENSLGHVSYFNNLGSDNAIEVLTKSSIFVEAIVCEGISSASNSLGLKTISAYPNPSSGFMTIEFDPAIDLKYLEVYNQLGQLVYKASDFSSNIQISKAETGSGLFFVKGKNSEQIEIIQPLKIIMN